MSRAQPGGLGDMTVELQHEPTVVEHAAQPYVGVTGAVTMTTFAQIADRFPDVFGWLGSRRIGVAGPPFFRYLVIDMERELIVEAGVPVATPVEGDGDVHAGVLPAGRYATVTHKGHPAELVEVTGALLAWADAQGLVWDRSESPDGERWGCRLEVLLTDPAEVPDMREWITQLVFKLA
jgi:effector-binding domain-containing protein